MEDDQQAEQQPAAQVATTAQSAEPVSAEQAPVELATEPKEKVVVAEPAGNVDAEAEADAGKETDEEDGLKQKQQQP